MRRILGILLLLLLPSVVSAQTTVNGTVAGTQPSPVTVSIYHPSLASGAAGTLYPDVTAGSWFQHTITSPTIRGTGSLEKVIFSPVSAQRSIRSAGFMRWMDIPPTTTQGFSYQMYGTVDWLTYRGSGAPSSVTGHRADIYTGTSDNFNVTFPFINANLTTTFVQYNTSATEIEGITSWVEIDSTGPDTTGIGAASNFAAYCRDGSASPGAVIGTCYNYYAQSNQAAAPWSFYAEPGTGPAHIPDGLELGSTTAKPTCDSSTRGRIYHFLGGTGVKDTVEVCAKDATDTYAWRVLY